MPQDTTAATTPRRQEGYERSREEREMLASPRPRAPGSRGHLLGPLSGPCCPEPEQLQPGFQFWKMQQSGNQRRLSPPAHPVSGHGVDLALDQLHCHGQ
jgi:hypothetical protein